MDFEEKIDAMRTTLELAVHDLEAQRANIENMGVKIEALRLASESQNESARVLLKATDNLRVTANRHQDDIQALKKMSGDLLRTAEVHERRISGLEGRS